MTKSELVLLFSTDDPENILDQLSKEFDRHSYAGNRDCTPSLIIVNINNWRQIELELAKRLKTRYRVKQILGYEKVTANSEGWVIHDVKQKGWNCLMFRGRPVVAIYGDNVIAARVGA